MSRKWTSHIQCSTGACKINSIDSMRSSSCFDKIYKNSDATHTHRRIRVQSRIRFLSRFLLLLVRFSSLFWLFVAFEYKCYYIFLLRHLSGCGSFRILNVFSVCLGLHNIQYAHTNTYTHTYIHLDSKFFCSLNLFLWLVFSLSLTFALANWWPLFFVANHTRVFFSRCFFSFFSFPLQFLIWYIDCLIRDAQI